VPGSCEAMRSSELPADEGEVGLGEDPEQPADNDATNTALTSKQTTFIRAKPSCADDMGDMRRGLTVNRLTA
jgi:hypothetical protein